MGNTCLTPLLLLPFYLLVSKIMCSNKGIGFVFVKDESVITIKNRLTHHPHSLASLFYKEERNKHLHLNSRAPWKWRSWAQQCLSTLPHILTSTVGHGPVCDPGCDPAPTGASCPLWQCIIGHLLHLRFLPVPQRGVNAIKATECLLGWMPGSQGKSCLSLR